jgi:class 3 adenylate cyclase/ActR/RegA family two-component response regulator
MLETQGYEVQTASGGIEALEKINLRQPHLVLLDVMMPDLSGYEVCKRLRAAEITVLLPIIMVTASDELERIKAIEVGADDFLSKPINQPELFARVKSLLRISQLQERIIEKNQELSLLNATLVDKVAAQVDELGRLNGLKRFLPNQVANQIFLEGNDALFKPHRREISVVFIDLRGFTSLVDAAEPEEVMKILTEYHTEMGRLIVKYNGTLEHFAGDGIMIFFNDPIPCEDHSNVAIQLAIEMQVEFIKLQSNWKKMGYQLGFGVGVARGYATLFMMGFEGRHDYAAIGSVCNLAARLCDEAKDGEILLDIKTHARLSSEEHIQSFGDFTPKGFARSIEIFKISRASLI